MEELLIAYHITWPSHNSRVSQRMIDFRVPVKKPVIFCDGDQREIIGYLCQIIANNKFKVLAINILSEHVHLVLVCKEEERDSIVKTLKSHSTYLYKKQRGIKCRYSLWAQKYSYRTKGNEKSLFNAIEYVESNREKHNVTEDKEIEKLVQGILTPYEEIY